MNLKNHNCFWKISNFLPIYKIDIFLLIVDISHNLLSLLEHYNNYFSLGYLSEKWGLLDSMHHLTK